jgi:hypothetical protein
MEFQGSEVGWTGNEEGMDLACSKGGRQRSDGKPGTAELEVGEDRIGRKGRMMEGPGFRGIIRGHDLSMQTRMLRPGSRTATTGVSTEQQAVEGERGVLEDMGQGGAWRQEFSIGQPFQVSGRLGLQGDKGLDPGREGDLGGTEAPG